MNKDAALEAISLENLTWSQEEFSLSDYVDKFPLPQIVKVQDGYYGPDEDSCLGADQIIFLHAIKHTDKVKARDKRKRELHIPLNCSQKVEIRPLNLKETFESVSEIAEVFSKRRIPEFVRVTQGYYSINGDNVCVNPGDKLKLIRVVSGQSEDYLVVETQDGSGFPLRIPLSASAGFQPLNDGREYYLQEAINENSMPFFFQFINPRNLNATGEASVFNSALGVLRAEKTYRDSSVICTTMEEGTTRTVVTCPKNLEITVTAASGALIGDKDYMRVCRFFHDGVSLKRIENMECFNVFASRETIREYLYDTPKTQDEDIPQYEYTEPSNDDDEHEYTYISDEDLSTFQRFDYEKFKSSFVEVKTDPEEEARKDEEEDTDEYEDMQLPEQTKDDQSSAKPVIYLQKPTPPPVKPKPVVKVQGTHHIMENNDSRQKSASESEEKPMPDPVSKVSTTKSAQEHHVEPEKVSSNAEYKTLGDTDSSISTVSQNTRDTGTSSNTTNELEQMTVTDVSKFLEKQHLAEFIETFEYNQIDGEMLMSMELDMMESLGMNIFQRKKLIKLIQGWRPKF